MKRKISKLSGLTLSTKYILMIISVMLPAIAGCECEDQLYNYSDPNDPYYQERIFVSTDAGETWQKQNTLDISCISIGYTYYDEGYKIIIAGKNNFIFSSTNLGATWKDTMINYVDFFTGMAFSPYEGVFSILDNSNSFIHSTDYASSWHKQSAPPGEKLKYIDFRPSTTTYQAAVGDFSDRIYLTTNGGNNWVYAGTGVTGTERFTGIKYIRDNIIAAFGYDSLMLRSTDYGNTWDFQDMPGTASILSLEANPELHFLIGGSNAAGKFWYSPDLGNTWEHKEFTSPTYRSRYFSVSYSSIILGVGNQGEMVKSTDMGNTWRKITSVTDRDFSDVLFINNSVVVAVCY